MNLANIMLSERSQFTMDYILYDPIYLMSRISESIETERRLVVA